MEGLPARQEEAISLDRKGIASRLRERGIDVDFEDWDGLSDERVIDIAWHKVFIRGGIKFTDIITDKEEGPFQEQPHEV